MITTDLTTLKINKLTKAQYEAALAAGTISENELYMTSESGTVQPDWNVNDSTSASYVKNRPFYTGDVVETVLLKETTAEFKQAPGATYWSEMSISPDFSFVVGQTYNVSWDGTLYTCISYEFSGVGAIGSQYIVTRAGDDTGEPFLIGIFNGTFSIYTRDTSASHTISITVLISEVFKIDKKYIPELDNYLSKNNPIGTGSFSLNRKADTTIGNNSFAEGYKTTASGSYSHAEGQNTTASYDSSHAEGYNTTASNICSHAEGASTIASGGRSHAEGFNTTASGSNSHAEGSGSIASGESSHSEGIYTTASSNYQHVQGKYNITDNSNTYADIIGNGTSDAKRSNASTVDWSGNAWYAGDVYVGSTSGTNKDEGSKKLATEEYVSSLKPIVTTFTLLASSWDSAAKTYSFEADYPVATYDIEIALDSTATAEQSEAFNAAQIVGSATSNIVKAYGIVPTVDIPVIIKVVQK